MSGNHNHSHEHVCHHEQQDNCHDSCCHGDCGCHHAEEHGSWKRLVISVVLFSCGLLVTGLLSLPSWVQPLWLAVAIAPLVWSLLMEAVEEVGNCSVGENTLLMVAVVAAFIIGEWVEGALVLLLFVLGETIEHKAVEASRRTVSSLAAVTPDYAWRMDDTGAVAEIPAIHVVVGDILRVPPHSRVPVDCRVLHGDSEVDTAVVTGESLPVRCTVGDELLSGSINGAGELTVIALRKTEQSAAARILQLVEEAASKKGLSERFITRFARMYTPAVMAGAVMVAVVPPLFVGDWMTWIYRALAFLVASCPCALVISIPLCFYAGIAATARKGVLIKGGVFVEQLARVQAIGFDKTGTLTDDVLAVDTVSCYGDMTSDKALHIAAALENRSTHPIGRALCAAVDGDVSSVVDLQEVPGLGVRGVVDGADVACGGIRLMEQLGVDMTAFPLMPVYVWRGGEVIAAITLSAGLRLDAAPAIRDLRALGVSRLSMLTGDRLEAARVVADAVSLNDVKANLLPEDKLSIVQRWQQEGFVTAFVGDGINDAPVLMAADVGVAMGLGSSAAIETADAVLVSGGLAHLPRAVTMCRRTVHTVRANIAFSLAVKAVVLVLATIGLAPMWLAVFADTGVTVLCVLNALRLLMYK